MKRYPFIEWTVKHGRKMAWVVALLLFGLGGYGFFATGHIVYATAGTLLAIASYFCVRLGVETLEVIADTLLPR